MSNKGQKLQQVQEELHVHPRYPSFEIARSTFQPGIVTVKSFCAPALYRYTCILGSSLSRKKSPRMLKLITVMLMARPGKITIQGAEFI